MFSICRSTAERNIKNQTGQCDGLASPALSQNTRANAGR